MATSVISRILAALAALFILASCGGGSDVAPQQVSAQAAPFVGTPVAGTTINGSTRRQALAASSEVTRPTFDVSFQPTATANAFVKKSALAAVAASEAITIDQLFDWAEGAYPQYFPFHQSTRNGEYSGVNYDYRAYDVFGGTNYVGVDPIGDVFGMGPYTGNVLVPFGPMASFQCVVNPTSCGPELQSAKLMDMKTGVSIDASGATGVLAKGTKLVLSYDQVDCTGVGGTGVVGQLVLTISCAENKVTFVPGIPGEERWTFGSDVTVSAAGLRNSAGYPSRLVEVTFSTKVAAAGQGAKVYTGNALGSEPNKNMGNMLSVFDVNSRSLVQNMDFGNEYNYSFWYGRVIADPVAGVLYASPMYGSFIYRIDLEDGLVLQPIWLGELNIGTRGMDILGDDLCVVRGFPTSSGLLNHPMQNSLVCLSRFTLAGGTASSANVTKDPNKVLLGLHAVGGKLYIPAVDVAAAVSEPPNDPARGRDGWLPGYAGTITEIDPSTKSVIRVFSVGSAPASLFADPTGKKLFAFNMGAKSASIVDLTTGVVKNTLLDMDGFERPIAALPDWEKGHIYVSDDVGTVRILSWDTRQDTLQEVGRINMAGETPSNMAIVRGKLWVTCYKQDTFYRGDKVVVVNRDTLAVETKITTRSGSPNPDFQANMPYAIAAYDPGP